LVTRRWMQGPNVKGGLFSSNKRASPMATRGCQEVTGWGLAGGHPFFGLPRGFGEIKRKKKGEKENLAGVKQQNQNKTDRRGTMAATPKKL